MTKYRRTATVLAIDLGGTKLAAALISADGAIVHKSNAELNGRSGPEVARLVSDKVVRLTQFAADNRLSVIAIGVAVPGASRPDGTVWAPNIPGWENYPLRRELTAVPGIVPVWIESDRTCYIAGETWKGAARGCNNAIFLSVGTGIGAGILVDGQVLRGADGLAGAVGWMALQPGMLAGYKKHGCFEHHASGHGLAALAGAPDARSVFAALKQNDSRSRKVIRQAVAWWGMAAANLVSIFNPEKIIFGGGLFGPAAFFLGDIRAESEKWAQPLAMSRVKFEISALAGQAGLYGAAFVALQKPAQNPGNKPLCAARTTLLSPPPAWECCSLASSFSSLGLRQQYAGGPLSPRQQQHRHADGPAAAGHPGGFPRLRSYC